MQTLYYTLYSAISLGWGVPGNHSRVPLLPDDKFSILADIQRVWHMRICAALLRRVPRYILGITSWYLNSAMIQLRNKLQDNVVLNLDLSIIV